MICPQCYNSWHDSWHLDDFAFCPVCGVRLIEETEFLENEKINQKEDEAEDFRLFLN